MQHPSLARQLQVTCLLLGILWAGYSPRTARAQQGEVTDTQVYEFGLNLFRLGDYYRAITEFKRFSLLFPQHERQPAAELFIGLALQEDKAYNDALAYFQHWRLVDDPTDATRVATFKLGELRFLQRQYRQAVVSFQDFLDAYPQGPLV